MGIHFVKIAANMFSLDITSLYEMAILCLACKYEDAGLVMSNEQLARDLRASKRCINYSIKRLTAQGYIVIEYPSYGKRIIRAGSATLALYKGSRNGANLAQDGADCAVLDGATCAQDGANLARNGATCAQNGANLATITEVTKEVSKTNNNPPSPLNPKSDLLGDPLEPRRAKAKTGVSLNGYTKEFETFWRFYPRPVSKGDAFKAWRQLNPDPELAGLITDRIKLRARGPEWKSRPIDKLPYPGTWIRARGWEDQFELAEEDLK